MWILEVKDLSFSYTKKKKVLDGISFRFDKGVFYVIAGANGAGKSSFLKVLSGIYKNYQGDIFLNTNGTISNMKGMRNIQIASYLSYLPSDIGVYFDFSVFDVILMGRRRFKGFFDGYDYNDKMAVYEVAKEVGILDIIDANFNEISNGERQLVLIAQSLVQQTDILLIDEPTSHLDIKHKLEILKILKDISKKGRTVISVMHDLKPARCFSDEIIFMKEGRIVLNINSSDFENNLSALSNIYDVEVVEIGKFL